jgi:hypothetical protein
MEQNQTPPPAIRYDLGHQGDIDYTLLDLMLALTPEERLRKHERWRLFVKEAVKNASLLERRNSAAG